MHDSFHIDGILEIRMEYFMALKRLQEIRESESERVFISKDVSWRPELRGVRMTRAGH